MMEICKECLYPSIHPLGIIFEDGVCSGCKIHKEKYEINWKDRIKELSDIFKVYKAINNYDCIIPVTGSGDSFYIVHQVKNVFNMNPLLVTYNNQFNTSTGIRNLARLKMKFDCDLVTLTIDPQIVKKITRETILRKGSIYWQSIAGQTVFPVQIACKFKIPLIIWGAHQGLDQVGMYSHHDRVEMNRKYRYEHDLMGLEAEDLIGGFEGLTESEVMPFIYPQDEEIASVGVRGIYLNNYMFWNSRLQHEAMINNYGYESMKQTRTFDTYSNASCWNYNDLHDKIKYLKHGFGKVVDHASREIRLGQMTRNEGINLVLRFINLPPVHDQKFYDWFGVTRIGLNHVLDKFRNPIFWNKRDDLQWEYCGPYKENLTNIEAIQCGTFKPYTETLKINGTDPEDEYIVIGKGLGN